MPPESRWRRWSRRLAPVPRTAPPTEWLRASLGACVGLALCCLVTSHLFSLDVTLRLAAPLGASSLLLFAVSSSPLAQPWSVLLGNLVAALVGTACGLWIDHTVLAATLSMAFTVLAMYSLRCLHPPGTALAVAVALGGPAFEALGFGVAWPVLMGSAVLIISALAYNRLTRGALVNAPAQPRNDSHLTDDPLPSERAGFAEADLDQALADFGEFVDITRDDLERLLRQTERVALRRGMGRVTAEHIMSRDLRTLSPDASLADAWKLFRQHRIKLLPVLDADGALVGVVTPTDLLHHGHRDPSVSLLARLRPQQVRVRQLMTREVRSVRPDTDIGALVSLLSDQGLHGLPVQDEQGRLVGLVTQSDLIGGLYRHWLKDAAPAPLGAPALQRAV